MHSPDLSTVQTRCESVGKLLSDARNREEELPVAKKLNQSNDPWKSKGVGKLHNVVQRLFDVLISPERQIAVAEAKAKAQLANARSSAEAEASAIIARAKATTEARIIEAEGAATVRAIEARAAMRIEADQVRQQRNIETIMAIAYNALPHSDADVSDEPVSDAFIHRFFDDSKNISDDQMQVLWGRLLAGEIARPGTYQPKTLSVIKDLTKEDAELFTSVCSFAFDMGQIVPVIFDCNDEIYMSKGVSFDSLSRLEVLGLLNFETINGFSMEVFITNFEIGYGFEAFLVKLPIKQNKFRLGDVLFSAAGQQIAKLISAETISEFPDYAIENWQRLNIEITRLKDRSINSGCKPACNARFTT